MSTVDLSKIQPGDRVRVRYRGLEGWLGVTRPHNRLILEPLDAFLEHVEILEHEPAARPVEVLLPAPEHGEWTSTEGGVISVHAYLPDGEVSIVTPEEAYLTPDDAEAFALRVLAIARSLKES